MRLRIPPLLLSVVLEQMHGAYRKRMHPYPQYLIHPSMIVLVREIRVCVCCTVCMHVCRVHIHDRRSKTQLDHLWISIPATKTGHHVPVGGESTSVSCTADFHEGKARGTTA
ncbi:unnamed protein product, partial [Ectocarpus sp. 13 AM-2016]